MSRPRYERPTLIRHHTGMMNKLARAQGSRPLSHLDGVPVAELLARFGSPLFVFSERTLVARYRELRDALSLRLPRVQLAWSYKTNYLDAICRLFHREGAWAEVVSELELDKARRLGVPGSQILFNGPYKPASALEKAFRVGAAVHLDHFDEVRRAEEVAQALHLRPRVAIRINLAVDGTPAWSRFGFNLENGEAMDAAKRVLTGGHLDLVGVHCHLGTFIQDASAYRQEAAKLAAFANALASEQGATLEYLDLGGGLASPNTLTSQYLPGEQLTPTFAAYAEAMAEGLAELRAPANTSPTIFIESGRALIDEAGTLLATVHANKRLPDGRRGVVLDAGVNLLFTAAWYKHDVLPTRELSGTAEPTAFFGPLCMSLDVLREQVLFPPLAVDDVVAFRNVGAYNVTQWMQFIVERPAVVLIGAHGEVGVMRRRESLETLLAQEEVPGWVG